MVYFLSRPETSLWVADQTLKQLKLFSSPLKVFRVSDNAISQNFVIIFAYKQNTYVWNVPLTSREIHDILW